MDEGEQTDTDRNERGQFIQGVSGNPKGKPAGARNKLGEAFLEDMLADWSQHGAATIEKVRTEKPDVYVKVVASILPRDLNVNFNPLQEATDDELVQRLRDLDAIIRPFLGFEGSNGDSAGTPSQKAH